LHENPRMHKNEVLQMSRQKIHKTSKDMVIVLRHLNNAMCHVFIHNKPLLFTPCHFESNSS
jgi:hypothetical protein